MTANNRINHAIGRIERGEEMLREETARNAAPVVLEYLAKWIGYWQDERDRLIDELVDAHQAEREDWSSRLYRR